MLTVFLKWSILLLCHNTSFMNILHSIMTSFNWVEFYFHWTFSCHLYPVQWRSRLTAWSDPARYIGWVLFTSLLNDFPVKEDGWLIRKYDATMADKTSDVNVSNHVLWMAKSMLGIFRVASPSLALLLHLLVRINSGCLLCGTMEKWFLSMLASCLMFNLNTEWWI